jgi:hypothetical protein
MSAISPAHSVRPAGELLHASGVQPSPGRSPLPSPGVAGPADYQDAVLLLMRADVQQGVASRALGRTQIDAHKHALDTNRKKEAQAVVEQQKAEKESHGFWAKLKKFAGTVAKIAAVAAAAVSAVFTGGATLVAIAAIAAVALSGGAMVVRETRMFGSLSDKVGLGMDIASAVVGIAACGAGALSAVKAADETAQAVKVVTAGAQLTGAVANGTSAVAGGVVAGYEHDADLAAADAAEARSRMQTASRDRQMVMTWLAQVVDVEADAASTTMKTLEACNQATNIAIGGIRA